MISLNTVQDNASIARDDGPEATPKPLIIRIQDKKQRGNETVLTSGINSSTPELFVKSISEDEIPFIFDGLRHKERLYDQTVRQSCQSLMIALRSHAHEGEVLSQAEELIFDIAEQYSLRFLGEVLTNVYIKCYDQQNIIAGICFGLERFDACEVSPWGQSIVIGLVNHKSDLVKERVISLIENWSDVSLLPVLKNIDISSAWMKEYINKVIASLEEKNVLYKETF